MSGDAVDNELSMTINSLHYNAWLQSQPSLTAGSVLESGGTSRSRSLATGPGTMYSFPAMLTGTLRLSNGGLGPLSDSRPQIAATLGREGFATAGFNSNRFLLTHFAYVVGFDAFGGY